MKYEVDRKEHFSVLKLRDEKLNSLIAPDLKTEFINLHTAGTKNLILDLESVQYADSSGLSSILTGNRVFGAQDGALVLCNLNPHVQKLITISQLDTVLTLCPTLDEARQLIFMKEIEADIDSSD